MSGYVVNNVSTLHLSSERYRIIATPNLQVSQKQKSSSLHHKKANSDNFSEMLLEHTNYNNPLKTRVIYIVKRTVGELYYLQKKSRKEGNAR